jgi:hypothetical protein
MNSSKNTARLAGLLWVLMAVTTGFSLVYVRPKLIEFADAAATANNILAFAVPSRNRKQHSRADIHALFRTDDIPIVQEHE